MTLPSPPQNQPDPTPDPTPNPTPPNASKQPADPAPDTLDPTQTCADCGARTLGNYCTTCGLDSRRGRLDMREIIADGIGSLIDFDRPFWITVKRLIASPGELTRDYISGKRRRFASPLRVFLVFATFATVAEIIATGAESNLLNEQPLSGVLSEHTAARAWTLNAFKANAHFINLLLIPLIAVAYLPLFRKSRYNLAEHTAGVLYAYAIFFVEFVTVSWKQILGGSWLGVSTQAFSIVYPMIVAVRIYQAPWISGLLKALVAQVCLYVLLSVFGILVVFVVPPLISPFFPSS